MIDYLTPKSSSYYERIRTEVSRISKTIGFPIVIYGGMVRDMIIHYYEYQNNNMIDFIEPNDVDLHIMSSSKDHIFSMNHYNYMMKILWDNKMIEKDETDYITIYKENYSLVKFVINGIKFDISANINNWCIYNDIADYSINCLTIIDNILGVRAIDMDVNEIITHIEKKELHCVLDKKNIQRYIDYWKENENVIQHYDNKMIERHQKMINKGFYDICDRHVSLATI